MNKVYVMLANGFEEIEGLTVVDLLRRAGAEVTTVSLSADTIVSGSHQIIVKADIPYEAMREEEAEILVLPGGMPGTKHLAEQEELCQVLRKRNEEQRRIAAICAAPSLVFGTMGLLDQVHATCYPGMEGNMRGAICAEDPVVTDGHITTSRGVGTAIAFALELIRLMFGSEKADEIQNSIVY